VCPRHQAQLAEVIKTLLLIPVHTRFAAVFNKYDWLKLIGKNVAGSARELVNVLPPKFSQKK
jgi:hypothetical protein